MHNPGLGDDDLASGHGVGPWMLHGWGLAAAFDGAGTGRGCRMCSWPYLFSFTTSLAAAVLFRERSERLSGCSGGVRAVYALGYVGYMLMPAIGPLEEMGARSGGWLTETGRRIYFPAPTAWMSFPAFTWRRRCFC